MRVDFNVNAVLIYQIVKHWIIFAFSRLEGFRYWVKTFCTFIRRLAFYCRITSIIAAWLTCYCCLIELIANWFSNFKRFPRENLNKLFTKNLVSISSWSCGIFRFQCGFFEKLIQRFEDVFVGFLAFFQSQSFCHKKYFISFPSSCTNLIYFIMNFIDLWFKCWAMMLRVSIIKSSPTCIKNHFLFSLNWFIKVALNT